MHPLKSPISNVRLLDASARASGLDLASEVFHRINRIIPADQKVLSLAPSCTVREAVKIMRLHGYSQVPVVEYGEVLGVFSFRSFAKEAGVMSFADMTKQKCAPGDLSIDEFLEHFEFARVTEEMTHVFDAMDRDNGVLIGAPERLLGVLTPMDLLRYLYKVASPFVTIFEIELALRVLINLALPLEQLAAVAQVCLVDLYKGRTLPTSVDEMTFDNYQTLISHGESWTRFEALLGGTRTRASAKLKQIGQIRNDLFHFKREITMEDHQILSGHRNWLLTKVKQGAQHRNESGE